MPKRGVSNEIWLDLKSGEGKDDVKVSGVIKFCCGIGIDRFITASFVSFVEMEGVTVESEECVTDDVRGSS